MPIGGVGKNTLPEPCAGEDGAPHWFWRPVVPVPCHTPHRSEMLGRRTCTCGSMRRRNAGSSIVGWLVAAMTSTCWGPVEMPSICAKSSVSVP